MNQEYLSVRDGSKFNPPQKEGRSLESKLLITTLVLFFIALNVWGYYFYRKGIFGISADISADISNTPTPTPKNFEKSDSIYMLPGV